ncbi:MAG: thermonuclease family protein [Candidatus Peribacteraceae bacterium]|nr:thermonuclease family protein [Candidatus Peribacteraceae bacterium]
MLRRFALPAILLAVFGAGLGGGAAYSWQTLQAQRTEILQLQEFCKSVELGPNFTVVERVIDGDTFKLSDGERVRLIGIDAPEICHFQSNGAPQDPDCVDEPGGQAATEFLRDLVEGEEVVLVGDEVIGDRDYFGRLLR